MIPIMFYWGWGSPGGWPRGASLVSLDKLVIYFDDATGAQAHTRVAIPHTATSVQIQAYLDALQAATRAKVAYTERTTKTVNPNAVAATAYNSVTAPYALVSIAVKLQWSCGVGNAETFNSLFAPKETDINTDIDGNLQLNPAATHTTAIKTAAQALMTNNVGQFVSSLLTSKLKARS
jgi:hypothetical protein